MDGKSAFRLVSPLRRLPDMFVKLVGLILPAGTLVFGLLRRRAFFVLVLNCLPDLFAFSL